MRNIFYFLNEFLAFSFMAFVLYWIILIARNIDKAKKQIDRIVDFTVRHRIICNIFTVWFYTGLVCVIIKMVGSAILFLLVLYYHARYSL